MPTAPCLRSEHDFNFSLDSSYFQTESGKKKKKEEKGSFFPLGAEDTIGGTDGTFNQEGLQILPAKSSPYSQSQKKEEKISEVAGTVTSIEETYVICELNLKKDKIEIQLPKTIFPQPPICGTPFLLSIDETGGIRKPIVKLRTIKPKPGPTNIDDEMEALVNQL